MSSVKRIDTFYVVINEDDGVLSSYRSIKCDSKEEADKLADRIRNNREYCRNLNDSLAYNRRRLNEIDRGE
jgi:hypothetical protein